MKDAVHRIRPLVASCLLFAVVLATAADAQIREELDGTPIAPSVASAYESNWRKYAQYAFEFDGAFGYIPNYDRRLPSSLGTTTTQFINDNKIVREERNGNLVLKRQIFIPREDAEAYVNALPDTAIGSYGKIASAQIIKVIDGDQMLIKDVWLVDQDRLREEYARDRELSARRNNGEPDDDALNFQYAKRIELKQRQDDRRAGFTGSFRLVGFDTRGLRAGDRWYGPNDQGIRVVVMRYEQPEPDEQGDGRSRFSRRSDNQGRLVLANVDSAMRQSLDNRSFAKLLDERGMSIAAFVELVRTLRDNDRANAEDRIKNALLPPQPPREN